VEARGRGIGQPTLRSAAVNHRLTSMAVILFLWALAIFARLIVLQVLQHQKYVAIARKQQEEEIPIPAPRGTIFDRNGQPLAISVPVASVSVNPLQIADPRMASEVLGSFLKLDRAALQSKLAAARSNHKGFLWIKHDMDPFETERLKSLHLAYATFHTESDRHYPSGETAAHVLGGLGVIPKEGPVKQGVLGIERGLDKVLRGQDGSESVLMDVHHNGIDSKVDSVERPGTQLTLSIDSRMQFVAERELKAGVIAKHARSGTAIVMNPYTGEILALANYPTYDPNKAPEPADDPISRWNLGSSVPFEPGSMFKVITLTAALETTNLTPDSMIPTGNGILVLPGRVIHESHGGLGTISMADVLAKSSNIGAIMIGMKVGRENMYDYARRFGFGQRSGLPLPAESPGILRPLNRWGTTSLASIAMGQEVSVTSIQIARAACAIANGGMLVKPRLVIRRGDKPEAIEPPVRIIKPETAILMRQMMEGVVLRGTGRVHARLSGYTSAGKTGTAQIYDPETHRYSHNYNASFVGFAPVTNPALVVLVTMHKTTGENGQGADTAAPVFTAIMTEALRMLDVPRDIPETEIASAKPGKKEKNFDDVSIADLGGTSIMEEDPSVRQLLADQKQIIPAAAATADIPPAPAPSLALSMGGRGPVFAAPAQMPMTAPTPPPTAAPVSAPLARDKQPMVPDFRGKSMRDAMEAASEDGIEVMVEGSGVARAQQPLPGTPLHQGDKIRIVFTR
jgi:cell division protein FtsI (penicillin-binding protein 3)